MLWTTSQAGGLSCPRSTTLTTPSNSGVRHRKIERFAKLCAGLRALWPSDLGCCASADTGITPVLWSHYAHKHRGICLGFEVDEHCVKAVNYVGERIPLQIPPTEETMHQLLFTKYRDWSYEDEWRGWFRLDECDTSTGHYFCAFDDKISLREVIAGPLCDTPRATIDAALRVYPSIRPIKARLAFRHLQSRSKFAGLLVFAN